MEAIKGALYTTRDGLVTHAGMQLLKGAANVHEPAVMFRRVTPTRGERASARVRRGHQGFARHDWAITRSRSSTPPLVVPPAFPRTGLGKPWGKTGRRLQRRERGAMRPRRHGRTGITLGRCRSKCGSRSSIANWPYPASDRYRTQAPSRFYLFRYRA